jgi:hypothetical protein
VKVKSLLIFGAVVLAIGLGVPLVYFSLARFFTANARALVRSQRAVEHITREPQAMTEAVPEKIEDKAAANAAN